MKSGILKRALRRLLCLLLAAVLLPFPQKAFAEDAKLITVNAEGWMEERNCMPQLLLTDDGRCYISLEDAAKIAGFPLFLSGGTATFRGPNTEVQVELRSLQHRKYEGEDYYALEELMDRLCVFVCACQRFAASGKALFAGTHLR